MRFCFRTSLVLFMIGLATVLGPMFADVVSFVGGGGKTTALFALARHTPGTTLVTTTTKMGRDRTGGSRRFQAAKLRHPA